jgi:uncharacterized membrane protein YphA (DoxX/SURF4 family)
MNLPCTLTWRAILRIGLGSIAIVAALGKVSQGVGFLENISTFELIPPSLVALFGAILLVAELCVGLMLIIDWRTKIAACVLIAMLGMFVVAMVNVLAQSRAVDCGCFGVFGGEEIGLTSLARNFALIGLSIPLLLNRRRSREK